MNDARVVVGVIERVTKLTDPVPQLVRLENLARLVCSQIGKRVAVDVFHRDASRDVVVHKIVDAHNIFVSELEASPCFALEIVQHGPVVNNQIREKLEGDIALQLFVARQPDDSHAAAAERLYQTVALEKLLATSILMQRDIQPIVGSLVTHAISLVPKSAPKSTKLSATGEFSLSVLSPPDHIR